MLLVLAPCPKCLATPLSPWWLTLKASLEGGGFNAHVVTALTTGTLAIYLQIPMLRLKNTPAIRMHNKKQIYRGSVCTTHTDRAT